MTREEVKRACEIFDEIAGFVQAIRDLDSETARIKMSNPARFEMMWAADGDYGAEGRFFCVGKFSESFFNFAKVLLNQEISKLQQELKELGVEE